jgi:Fe-Mn family superoxide dismutase
MWWQLGWEFNGMRLHEYYFDTLGGNGIVDRNNRLARKKIEDFGSIEAWLKFLNVLRTYFS